ncbi:hypothetical protein A2U01_0100783, partial [Trifolium medium]|nr:hypothetical protein [Trifolium medium]
EQSDVDPLEWSGHYQIATGPSLGGTIT